MSSRRQIENTRKFIAHNPTALALSRSVRTPDGAGGTLAGSPTALDPQTVRLVAPAPNANSEVTTTDGETLNTSYSIIAMPGADIQEGDWFMLRNARHEVIVVADIGGYEVRAEAVRRG